MAETRFKQGNTLTPKRIGKSVGDLRDLQEPQEIDIKQLESELELATFQVATNGNKPQ